MFLVLYANEEQEDKFDEELPEDLEQARRLRSKIGSTWTRLTRCRDRMSSSSLMDTAVLRRRDPDAVRARYVAREIARIKDVIKNSLQEDNGAHLNCAYAEHVSMVSRDIRHLMRILRRWSRIL